MADATRSASVLLPAGALGAVAAGALVWIAPTGFLRPGEADRQVVVMPSVPPSAPPKPLEGPAAEWPKLAARLEALREPYVAPTTPGDQQQGESAPPPPPARSIAWQYTGFVQQPRQIVAVVTINGSQRFIFAGQTMAAENAGGTGGTGTLKVDRITADEIGVSWDGEALPPVKRTIPPPPKLLTPGARPAGADHSAGRGVPPNLPQPGQPGMPRSFNNPAAVPQRPQGGPR
ncbi:MAG: hypothetical protein IBJ11_03980 [Phycisphaerales bacterium]|nr:hypothetical protein [Phycisphaerales bacterium]